MTNAEEAKYLNYRFRGGSMTALTTAYAGLFSAAPGESSGGTEISGGGYSRLALSRNDWTAPTGGEPTTIQNGSRKSFPRAQADWGTVVAVGIFDAAQAGELLYFHTLSTPLTIQRHDLAEFDPGALKVGLG